MPRIKVINQMVQTYVLRRHMTHTDVCSLGMTSKVTVKFLPSHPLSLVQFFRSHKHARFQYKYTCNVITSLAFLMRCCFRGHDIWTWKRSAHENHPNFLKSLGHRPWPRVSYFFEMRILLEKSVQISQTQLVQWSFTINWTGRLRFFCSDRMYFARRVEELATFGWTFFFQTVFSQ